MSKLSQTLNHQNLQGEKNQYDRTIEQLKVIIAGEKNLIANLANAASLLKHNHDFFWVGFYRVDNKSPQKELVLGPFQGTLACTRISFGQGVCGTSWKEEQSIFVPHVHEFPGHIACDSRSEAEIVIFLRNLQTGKPWGVLDVDSDKKDRLTKFDFERLNEIGKIIEQILL